ncbi:MAG: ATP-binding protein, partial [Candidatus Bathyarchaeota archaeon]
VLLVGVHKLASLFASMIALATKGIYALLKMMRREDQGKPLPKKMSALDEIQAIRFPREEETQTLEKVRPLKTATKGVPTRLDTYKTPEEEPTATSLGQQRTQTLTRRRGRQKEERKTRRQITKPQPRPYTPPKPEGVFLGCEEGETPSQYGVLGRSSEGNVLLDLDRPHWIFVVGAKGSGKSYTLGVICEMLADKISQISKLDNPLSAIVIDNRGDFVSLQDPNTASREVKLLKKEYGAEPHRIANLSILTVEEIFRKGFGDSVFKIRPQDLTFDDWKLAFGLEETKQPPLWFMKFRSSLAKIKGNRDSFSIQDMIDHYLRQRESVSQQSVLSRLYYLQGTQIFDENAPDLLHFLNQNSVVILYTISCDKWVRILLSSLFLRRLREYCVDQEIKQQSGQDPDLLPNIWLVFDEAHFLLPARGETPFSRNLEEVMRIARHWGISVILATQNPDDIQDTMIGLCDLFIVHKISSINFIKKLANKVGKNLDPKTVGRLRRGEAVILDQTSGKVLGVSIRPRVSRHGGRTKTATKGHT